MNDSRGGGGGDGGGGGGRGVLPYMGTAIYGLYRVCDTVKDMVFKQFTPGIGYINQSVWV